MFHKEIIDNSPGNLLSDYLNFILENTPNTNLDIATAFFNLGAYDLLKEKVDGVENFRLLLGKAPEIQDQNKTLGDFLLDQVKAEVEGFDLIKDKNFLVKSFIEFLHRKNVEVRLFEDFLHGKAYITDKRVVIGSSNFTYAGLTRYGELNTWDKESKAIYTKKEWFEIFWDKSTNFKDELVEILESSRFGNKEYSPYEIYIKTLYELQKDELVEQKMKTDGVPETKVNLAEFQADAIPRVWTRLKKYNGCLIADSVGLGKTWIAKKVIEKLGYYERKNVLIICPAQLRDMWTNELKSINVNQNILSQEELGTKDFIKKAKDVLGYGFDDVSLIVIDESHNFRNPLSGRWENLFTLINDHFSDLSGKKPYMVLLTATPINNSVWDLYWQIMLMTLMDNASFLKNNIPDLAKFFRDCERNPNLLNDLLNEISIRRTRDYIIKNYPEAYITYETPDGEEKQQKIFFPKRTLKNIDYALDDTYHGMYHEIAEIITEKLTLANYRMLSYRKDGPQNETERLELGRMKGISGIIRTIMLKRLESSVYAFRKSVKDHLEFLNVFTSHLEQGKVIRKSDYIKYILKADDELLNHEMYFSSLDNFNKNKFDYKAILKGIDKDKEYLSQILEIIGHIEPSEDSKLNHLKETLLRLSKDGQTVLFTYYADTLNYLYEEISKDSRFHNINFEAISSSGKANKPIKTRQRIIDEFNNKKIDIILSTDVLSEGQNLQTARYLINYDLHWNPTRMIQRAGRIDRIGSKFQEIFVYNFFPEKELEELLKIVEILQGKISNIDKSIGLDQSVLGEVIHPKVFGTIRRINKKDKDVLKDLEDDVFGGGEKFYLPLKEFLDNKGREELEKMPYGIYSGLKKNLVSGIFFYYKFSEDFDFLYLYDINNERILKNKTEILDCISCNNNEPRYIPEFFEMVYEVNRIVLNDIEKTYKEIELSQTQDTRLKDIAKERSLIFIRDMINEIDLQIDDYLDEFPAEENILDEWEDLKSSLSVIYPTKKRASELRKIWRDYKSNRDWKTLIKRIKFFLENKELVFHKHRIEPYDLKKLQLITIDFIT